jgi:transcription antitermination factor NusG
MEGELLPTPSSWQKLDASVEIWAAIRTAARWEKKLAGRLRALNISVFLPTLVRVTKYKSRTNRAEVPLFHGYVFFNYKELDRLNRDAPAMQGIAQILKPPDPELLRTELAAISDLLPNAELVQRKVHGEIGEVVRVRRGAFKDTEGKIVRQMGRRGRLVIAVSYLGLSTEVELDDEAVEKVFTNPEQEK